MAQAHLGVAPSPALGDYKFDTIPLRSGVEIPLVGASTLLADAERVPENQQWPEETYGFFQYVPLVFEDSPSTECCLTE